MPTIQPSRLGNPTFSAVSQSKPSNQPVLFGSQPDQYLPSPRFGVGTAKWYVPIVLALVAFLAPAYGQLGGKPDREVVGQATAQFNRAERLYKAGEFFDAQQALEQSHRLYVKGWQNPWATMAQVTQNMLNAVKGSGFRPSETSWDDLHGTAQRQALEEDELRARTHVKSLSPETA